MNLLERAKLVIEEFHYIKYCSECANLNENDTCPLIIDLETQIKLETT